MISAEERAAIGTITLNKAQITAINNEVENVDEKFVTNAAGERVVYNGTHLTFDDLVRKKDKLDNKRAEFFRLNLLCAFT